MSSVLYRYSMVTKPGIVIGNTLALVTGYVFALLEGSGAFNWRTFLGSVIGTAWVMGSACVYNNLLDRDIDGIMERTKSRAFVTGSIPPLHGALYSIVLLYIGVYILSQELPPLAAYLALAAWALYAICYTHLKRYSYYAALVGSIPGSAPPVIGYIVAGGQSLGSALILFAIVVCWQMMHFYAIALMRKAEYAAASIPVISVVKGEIVTRRHIEWWSWMLSVALIISTAFAPLPYALLAAALSMWLLHYVGHANASREARTIFRLSLRFLLLWMGAVTLSLMVASAINLMS